MLPSERKGLEKMACGVDVLTTKAGDEDIEVLVVVVDVESEVRRDDDESVDVVTSVFGELCVVAVVVERDVDNPSDAAYGIHSSETSTSSLPIVRHAMM